MFCSTTHWAIAAEQPTAEELQFFETKIRPLLVESCLDCHNEDTAESDLRLDTLAGMLKGGKAGAAIIPGKPASSLLITAVGYQDGTLQMPPDGKLPKSAVADLTRWIEMGAPHPESSEVTLPSQKTGIDLEEGRKHWAFQPVHKPDVPETELSSWVVNPIDAFIMQKLEEHSLEPVPPADKRTLIRRATFDLTGLPPTPGEIADFLEDDTPEAFEKVINRLLDSPHYGERWGRHWLDVARYADSNGLDENVAHGNAWRYRDYVVQSLNEDKPYGLFLKEQLAGDLLDSGDDYRLKNEHLVATGFLFGAQGPGGSRFDEDADGYHRRTARYHRRSVMGLTLGCARCHDHKFDPIAQADYYSLAGIMKSTQTMESFKIVARWNENRIATPEQEAELAAKEKDLAAQKEEITAFIASATDALKQRLADNAQLPEKPETQFTKDEKAKLKELRDKETEIAKSFPTLPTAMSVKDGEIEDVPIHIRGSHLTLGETVERGFPGVIEISNSFDIPKDESGRLELAEWLTHPEHPLTARVMVNRLWRWHFGEGIVPSPDNFGLQGTPPTHPALLDWLAVTFQEKGYSLKEMHRLMMLSNTYQLSSSYDEQNAERDPGNAWFWRYHARRIEAESIRDAILAVSGTLDRTMGEICST
ncbi:MAG: PSD1 and planctomycete cytochrome C domain-containing protein [Planctomycetaceae bacterium]